MYSYFFAILFEHMDNATTTVTRPLYSAYAARESKNNVERALACSQRRISTHTHAHCQSAHAALGFSGCKDHGSGRRPLSARSGRALMHFAKRLSNASSCKKK